ncbi:MAG: YciI family protein [Longimicrobiales bacterium]
MKFLGIGYYDPTVYADLSDAERAKLGERCAPMDEEFRSTDRVRVLASLTDEERRFLTPGDSGTTITDGPFTEAKEVVGSFFIIEADDLDEAAEVASLHPAARIGKALGWKIELRPIAIYGTSEDGSEWAVEGLEDTGDDEPKSD